MPCAIYGETKFGDRTTADLFRLYYLRDGQLAVATENHLAFTCKGPDTPCKLENTLEATLRYRYEGGRLLEVRLTKQNPRWPRGTRVLSVNYIQGRAESYTVRSEPIDGTQRESSDSRARKTVIVRTPEATAGEVETIARYPLWFNQEEVEEKTAYFGLREPFAYAPVVWPYAPNTLYFGWSSLIQNVEHNALLKHEEGLSFDKEGRILSRSAERYGQGPNKLEFQYDCPEDPPAEILFLQ